MGHTGIMVEDTLFYYRKHGPSMLSQSNNSRRQLIDYIHKKHRRLYLNPIIRLRMAGAALKVLLSRRLLKSRIYNRAQGLLVKARAAQNDVHYLHMDGYRERIRRNIERQYTAPIKLPVPEKTPVLFILPWLEVGGVEQVFYNLVSQLDRNKFDIYMATTLYGANPWKDKFAEVCGGVFHLPYFTSGSGQAEEFIIDFIRSKGVRVVHISNSKLGYSLAPVIKKTFPEVKVIDLLHMDEPEEPWDYFRIGHLVKEYIDVRVVLTDYFKELLTEKFGEGPERIAVIPNGIDLSPFPARPPAEKVRRILEDTLCIGFVGRLHQQKEPLKFLQIARNLLKDGQAARFLLVGDGPLRSGVEEFIARHGLHKDIIMTGFRNDVGAILIEEIDLLLAPSRREGLPVTGLEALAAGVPVLASDVPGWDYVIQDGSTGYLVPGGSVEGFTGRCLELLRDRPAILDMGLACRRAAAEKYHRKVMASAYEKLYLGQKC
jgi:glycosyltransferase involved in cell wall biosynthesis